MLLANLDLERGLGNGARGVVVGFVNTADWVETCKQQKKNYGTDLLYR